MLGAVADRVDVRVAGAQPVVDDDAPAGLQAGRLGEAGPGADPDGDHQQAGVQPEAVGEFDTGDGAVVGQDGPDPALGVHLDAEVGQVPPEQRARLGVEVALHQVLALVGEDDRDPARRQCPGGAHPQQSAADHHGLPHTRQVAVDVGAVGHGAEGEDAVRQLVALAAAQAVVEQSAQRRQHRVAPGGEHQVAVPEGRAVVAEHLALLQVDPHHAGVAALDLRRQGRQGGDLRRVPAGQHLGEQHPVVRCVLLLGEQDDLAPGAVQGELLGQSVAGHPGADDHDAVRWGSVGRCHAIEHARRVFPVRGRSVSRAER